VPRFQNDRLSKSRLTRFDAVRRLILDEKCGARSPIVPRKSSDGGHKHSGIGKDLGRAVCLANRKSKSVRIDL
jgi:hypothetical protein